MTRLILCSALAIAAATQALATTFSADGASATSVFSSRYDPSFTIDGSGLSTPGDPAATHADYFFDNHWTTATGMTVGQSITWTFDTPATFGGIYIWNHRSSAGWANNPYYEPVLFDLEVVGLTTETYIDVALMPDTGKAQAFVADSTISDVTSVTFTVKATQANDPLSPFTGLAEVLFDDSVDIRDATVLSGNTPAPIPLPASLPLLAAALGGFGLLRRFKRLA